VSGNQARECSQVAGPLRGRVIRPGAEIAVIIDPREYAAAGGRFYTTPQEVGGGAFKCYLSGSVPRFITLIRDIRSREILYSKDERTPEAKAAAPAPPAAAAAPKAKMSAAAKPKVKGQRLSSPEPSAAQLRNPLLRRGLPDHEEFSGQGEVEHWYLQEG